MTATKLTFKDVDRSTWPDLERLFESPGGPKYCWCMAWRAAPAAVRQAGGQSRKAALRARVRKGVPVGILGYLDGDPVAWCSVAPRSTYRPLGGPDDAADNPGAVWSIVCFFIKREFRKRGLAEHMLKAALRHARRKGAKIVEAYPVDPDSPSYRFMGFVSLFERAGFAKTGKAGTRRHVMRLSLSRG